MRQKNCDRQTGSGIATPGITFVETSHCILLEVTENQYKNACRKIYIQQGVYLTANGTMFGTRSVCLKSPHRKCHLNLRHAEQSLLRVDCKLETVLCNWNMYRPAPQSYVATST
jgi:hypothetical protein